MAEIIFDNHTPLGRGIDDENISPTNTFSSEKIDGLLLDKADKARAGTEGEVLIKNNEGNPIASGKKTGDFATSEHTHMASEVPINPINFGGTLSRDITNIQEFADFVDDNIGFGRSIEYQIVDTELWIRKEGEEQWTKYDLGLGISEFNQTFDDNLKRIYTFTFTDGTTEEIVIDKPRGITSFEKTEGDGTPGTSDIYTITYTDGTTSEFQVINGANGEGAMQTVTSGDDVIKIDNTDPANPIIGADTYTKEATDDKLELKADTTYVDNQDNLRVLITDIKDNLTSIDTDKPLSANQGKILKDLIDNINAILTSDDTTLDEIQELVNYIKQNRSELEKLSVSNIAGLQAILDSKASQTDLDTKANQADLDTTNDNVTSNTTALDTKVDKVEGKGLSEKDFTAELENKLNGVNPDMYAKLVGDNTYEGKQTIKGIIRSSADGEFWRGKIEIGNANNSEVFQFGTRSDMGGGLFFEEVGSGNTKMILRNGNVGIGTTNPQVKLDVNGDIVMKHANRFYQFGADGLKKQIFILSGDRIWFGNAEQKVTFEAPKILLENIPSSSSGLVRGEIYRDGTYLRIKA